MITVFDLFDASINNKAMFAPISELLFIHA